MNCPNCNTKLLKGARFCHTCGTEIVADLRPCPHCEVKNPVSAKYCHACGQAMETSQNKKSKNKNKTKKTPYVPIYPIAFSSYESVEEQVKKHFFKSLKNRVSDQSNASKYSEYLEVFYRTGFNNEFETFKDQILQDILPLKYTESKRTPIIIDKLLDEGFEKILDRFTIEHTRHLNDFQLPNTILRYENIDKHTVDIQQMILDYLYLEQEELKVYSDFSTIPYNKIKNASKSFLFPNQTELIYLLCDQSVFGSFREGFAFTNEAIYWRAHFNKAQKAYYHELYSIKKEDNWITINDKYFFINRSMNFKIMKLLKKLKSIF